jgi:hypothetical protein
MGNTIASNVAVIASEQSAAPETAPAPSDEHIVDDQPTPDSEVRLRGLCTLVWRAIKRGNVVPFLGAGASSLGKTVRASFEEGLPPGGRGLAAILIEELRVFNEQAATRPHFNIEEITDKDDLLQIAQYFAMSMDETTLYEVLHERFAPGDGAYAPLAAHEFFADVAALAMQDSTAIPHQIIFTTNYDWCLEFALLSRRVPFDVVYYVAKGRDNERRDISGKFQHLSYDIVDEQVKGDANCTKPGLKLRHSALITSPNNYNDLPLDENSRPTRTLIIKAHGSAAKLDAETSSFVISEDDYIDYLVKMDPDNWFPSTLKNAIKNKRFLFLGYGLRDWSMRVLLKQLWELRNLEARSWAVDLYLQSLDRLIWDDRKVDIYKASLASFFSLMNEQLREGNRQ